MIQKISYTGTVWPEILLGPEKILPISLSALIGKIYYWPVLMIIDKHFCDVKVAICRLGKINCIL